MVISKDNTPAFPIERCHGGEGTLHCREILGDYEKKSPGFAFIHDDLIEPGASIGPHTHEGDEEIYFIVSGRGTMMVDGVRHHVAAGDVCLTRSGHSHSLRNEGPEPMRLIVACARI